MIRWPRLAEASVGTEPDVESLVRPAFLPANGKLVSTCHIFRRYHNRRRSSRSERADLHVACVCVC